jgi:hypothetical protein
MESSPGSKMDRGSRHATRVATLPPQPLLCCNGGLGRAEEARNEECSLSRRDDHAASGCGRAADKAGRRRTDRKVHGVLSGLVRDARQGAGLLQRSVHGHALQLTAALRTPCAIFRDVAGALKGHLVLGGPAALSMLADWCWLYTDRLHRRVVSFRNVNAGGSKHAYHRDRRGEYEKRNTIHWTLP